MSYDVDEAIDQSDEVERKLRGLDDDNRELRRKNLQLNGKVTLLEAQRAELAGKVAVLEAEKNELAAALLRMRDEQAAKMLKAVGQMAPTFTPVHRTGFLSPAARAVEVLRLQLAQLPGMHGACSALATLELAVADASRLAEWTLKTVGSLDLTGDLELAQLTEGEQLANAVRAAELQLGKAVLP